MTRTTFPQFALPSFIVDQHSIDRDGGHQIDWDAVPDSYRDDSIEVVLSGVHSAGATVLHLEGGLTGALSAGQALYFGETGEFVLVATTAEEGASAVSVQATPQTLEDGDTATKIGSGKKTIRAGTAMVGADTNDPLVPRGTGAAGTADCLLATTAVEDEPHAALSGYGVIVGGVVYENLLPDAAPDTGALATAIKTELNASTKGFVYRVYEDDRAS